MGRKGGRGRALGRLNFELDKSDPLSSWKGEVRWVVKRGNPLCLMIGRNYRLLDAKNLRWTLTVIRPRNTRWLNCRSEQRDSQFSIKVRSWAGVAPLSLSTPIECAYTYVPARTLEHPTCSDTRTSLPWCSFAYGWICVYDCVSDAQWRDAELNFLPSSCLGQIYGCWTLSSIVMRICIPPMRWRVVASVITLRTSVSVILKGYLI